MTRLRLPWRMKPHTSGSGSALSWRAGPVRLPCPCGVAPGEVSFCSGAAAFVPVSVAPENRSPRGFLRSVPARLYTGRPAGGGLFYSAARLVRRRKSGRKRTRCDLFLPYGFLPVCRSIPQKPDACQKEQDCPVREPRFRVMNCIVPYPFQTSSAFISYPHSRAHGYDASARHQP